MARNLKGIDLRGDPLVCMVLDCTKKALYRSPTTGARTGRGYCAAHRSLALTGARTDAAASNYDYEEHKLLNQGPRGWRIVCEDGER